MEASTFSTYPLCLYPYRLKWKHFRARRQMRSQQPAASKSLTTATHIEHQQPALPSTTPVPSAALHSSRKTSRKQTLKMKRSSVLSGRYLESKNKVSSEHLGTGTLLVLSRVQFPPRVSPSLHCAMRAIPFCCRSHKTGRKQLQIGSPVYVHTFFSSRRTISRHD